MQQEKKVGKAAIRIKKQVFDKVVPLENRFSKLLRDFYQTHLQKKQHFFISLI
jgi:hypothetical protein